MSKTYTIQSALKGPDMKNEKHFKGENQWLDLFTKKYTCMTDSKIQ